MDLEKLISAVQDNECLWNQKSKYYHSRDETKRAWSEVAKKFDTTVDELKKRWKGLRDIFDRELKKSTLNKSGDAANEYAPKWPYYHSMLFLKSTMTPRELKGSVPIEDDADNCESSGCETGHDSLHSEADEIMSPPISPLPVIQKTSSSKRIFTSPTKKPLKRTRMNDFDRKLLNIEEEKLKLFKGSNEDSETQFLMSLVPFLKKIPASRQLDVRMKLMQILTNENTFETHNRPLPSYISNDRWTSESSSSSSAPFHHQHLSTYYSNFLTDDNA